MAAKPRYLPSRLTVLIHLVVALVLPNAAWAYMTGSFGYIGLAWSGWYVVCLVGWVFIGTMLEGVRDQFKLNGALFFFINVTIGLSWFLATIFMAGYVLHAMGLLDGVENPQT